MPSTKRKRDVAQEKPSRPRKYKHMIRSAAIAGSRRPLSIVAQLARNTATSAELKHRFLRRVLLRSDLMTELVPLLAAPEVGNQELKDSWAQLRRSMMQFLEGPLVREMLPDLPRSWPKTASLSICSQPRLLAPMTQQHEPSAPHIKNRSKTLHEAPKGAEQRHLDPAALRECCALKQAARKPCDPRAIQGLLVQLARPLDGEPAGHEVGVQHESQERCDGPMEPRVAVHLVRIEGLETDEQRRNRVSDHICTGFGIPPVGKIRHRWAWPHRPRDAFGAGLGQQPRGSRGGLRL